jgi:hypothetical protein
MRTEQTQEAAPNRDGRLRKTRGARADRADDEKAEHDHGQEANQHQSEKHGGQDHNRVYHSDRAAPYISAMHLIWFHRVLIGAAILFFGGFGFWELARASGDRNAIVMGVVSILVALALLVYLYRLKRILKLPE